MSSETRNRHQSDFFELPQPRNIALYYLGYFSQNVVCSLAETMRLQLEQRQVSAATRRKLFSSFVEMGQNIIRYSAADLTENDSAREIRHGSICIGVEAERYFLLGVNPVHPADLERLRVRLEPLKTMTLDEIRQAYKASLRDETPPWSKGADIGLLTVARDASEPLQFAFRNDEATGLSTFYLKAII